MSDRLNAQNYFRSFEQLNGTEAATVHNEGEFVGYDPKELTSMPRRRFMKLMGATMAVAGVGLTGCRRWPKEHLVPSTAGLRDQLPGIPEFFATAFERGGVADSLLVTSYDGRPIKIEGNPLHPMYTTWRNADGTGRLAAADAIAQASILEMYDPSRSRDVVDNTTGTPKMSTWDAFLAAFNASAGNGAGLAVLSEATSSLTHAAVRARFQKKFPQATWTDYEPLNGDSESAASQIAFGRPVRAMYDLSKARTIVSLDGDLLGLHPNRIRHANDWSAGRRSADSAKTMNRLYIAESAMTITGSVADHRLPLKPSQLTSVALGLAAALGVAGATAPDLLPAQRAWVDAAAADLKAAGNAGVVAAGLSAQPQVQALAYAINFALGAVGNTVAFHDLPGQSDQISSLRGLCDRMASGQVQTLLILGGNPVYNAPADLGFASKLGSVRTRIHLSNYKDETSRACTWHLPRSHYLESWGDARSWDGSVVLQQPLILPLGDSKSPVELLATLSGEQATDGQTLVRSAIAQAVPAVAAEPAWRSALHDGLIPNSTYAALKLATPTAVPTPTQASGKFELRYSASSQTYDGRYANNGWLVECPDPITKLVWDNAAIMNKSDADELGIAHGDLIELKLDTLALTLPAYVQWGQPRGVIGLSLGFGRTAAGPIGGDPTDSYGTPSVGFDTYKIRRSGEMFAATNGVEVRKTGESYDLVTTQDYQAVDWPGLKGTVDRIGTEGKSGRVIREGSLADYVADPKFANKVVERLPLLQLWDSPYPSVEEQKASYTADPGAPTAFNNPHAWGMAIDMSTCIGCSACVVACQSENNIPTVGKAMVRMNREMHWIRIDRYYKAKLDEARQVQNNDYENIEIVHQPIMCVHCENAPCEQVCPVAATVHDTEGLNTMVYNRCIGTRYCSNNCPYKVRRFNYMDWHSRNPHADGTFAVLNSTWLGLPDTQQAQSIQKVRQMVYNPEVTIRMRGVMEKCTYCTQRIKAATIKRKADWAKSQTPTVEPKVNGQPKYTVDDFDVVTACMQACPTQAITFGNLLDKTSVVRKLHAVPRSYALLEDLNTRPRTLHMAKIRNQNESLAGGSPPTPRMGSEKHEQTG